MIRCVNCGESFDDEEIHTRSECVGEFWGSPAYMNVSVCPSCGSDDLEELEDPLDDIYPEADNEHL